MSHPTIAQSGLQKLSYTLGRIRPSYRAPINQLRFLHGRKYLQSRMVKLCLMEIPFVP